MSIQENIAKYLRSKMEEQKASLTEYSKNLGIGRTTLQGYLNGTSAPRSDTIEYLARQVGCTPAELISDMDEISLDATLLCYEAYRAQLHPLICEPVTSLVNEILAQSLSVSAMLYELDAKYAGTGQRTDNDA